MLYVIIANERRDKKYRPNALYDPSKPKLHWIKSLLK